MELINSDIYRLLDANINRAMEGIRVLEETSRMLFNDSDLTKQIKNLRHSLVKIIKQEKGLDRLMLFARNSESDVLRNGKTDSESTRADIIAIVRANSSRSQEAARSLEEYIKLSHPSLSEKFKKIRFGLYDIEKELVSRIHLSGLANERRLGLYVVIDREKTQEMDIYDITHACVDGGAGTVSYRDKVSHDCDFMKNAEIMLSACADREVTKLADNRLDIAMIIRADGVCVELGDIPVKVCRNSAGHGFVIASLVQIDKYASDVIQNEADFYITGPIFNKGKNGEGTLRALEKFVSQAHAPVLAFGGITLENISSVLDCGVTGISLNPDFPRSGKINLELQKFRKIIETYRTNVSSS